MKMEVSFISNKFRFEIGESEILRRGRERERVEIFPKFHTFYKRDRMMLVFVCLMMMTRETETLRWRRLRSKFSEEDKAFFKKHGDITSVEELYDPFYAKDLKMGYARGGATNLRNLEHPPSRKIREKSYDKKKGKDLRFKAKRKFPPEPTPDEQWIMSYSQMASVYGEV